MIFSFTMLIFHLNIWRFDRDQLKFSQWGKPLYNSKTTASLKGSETVDLLWMSYQPHETNYLEPQLLLGLISSLEGEQQALASHCHVPTSFNDELICKRSKLLATTWLFSFCHVILIKFCSVKLPFPNKHFYSQKLTNQQINRLTCII